MSKLDVRIDENKQVAEKNKKFVEQFNQKGLDYLSVDNQGKMEIGIVPENTFICGYVFSSIVGYQQQINSNTNDITSLQNRAEDIEGDVADNSAKIQENSDKINNISPNEWTKITAQEFFDNNVKYQSDYSVRVFNGPNQIFYFTGVETNPTGGFFSYGCFVKVLSGNLLTWMALQSTYKNKLAYYYNGDLGGTLDIDDSFIYIEVLKTKS